MLNRHCDTRIASTCFRRVLSCCQASPPSWPATRTFWRPIWAVPDHGNAKMNPQIHLPIIIKGRPVPWHDAPALLRDKAQQHGDKTFCVIDGRRLSYVELDGLCDCVGANLAAAGVGERDCVASMMF